MNTKLLPALLLIVLLTATAASAQNDSLPRRKSPLAWSELSCAPLPLAAGAVLLRNESRSFRSSRHTFARHGGAAGDYARFLPLGVTALLKIGGVHTRSDWGRLGVRTAAAGAVTVAGTLLLKDRLNEWRPDGSNRHSFPSGHTALAFMSATVMHKELGAQSAWYSVGAYAVATAISLERATGNRHWVHDLMAGAALGIVSTDLAYLATGWLWGDDGEETHTKSAHLLRRHTLSVGMGATLGAQRMQIGDIESGGLQLVSRLATAVQTEYRFYLNRNLFAAGRADYLTAPVMCENLKSVQSFYSDRLQQATLRVSCGGRWQLSGSLFAEAALSAGGCYTLPWQASLSETDAAPLSLRLSDSGSPLVGAEAGVGVWRQRCPVTLTVGWQYSETGSRARMGGAEPLDVKSRTPQWRLALSIGL